MKNSFLRFSFNLTLSRIIMSHLRLSGANDKNKEIFSLVVDLR